MKKKCSVLFREIYLFIYYWTLIVAMRIVHFLSGNVFLKEECFYITMLKSQHKRFQKDDRKYPNGQYIFVET